MPRKEIDYSKTIIYKIVSNDLSIKECYVGHTTDFITRKSQHKSDCNNEKSKSYNIRLYSFIRENATWSNWSMIEIEKFPCIDKNEACSRERYWIETLQATLNCIIPTRTQKEYYETHKEELYEKKKEYYETHKEEICEKKKEYRETHKEEIRQKDKERYETHKEKRLEKSKEYYEIHKQKVCEKNKEYRKKKAEYFKEKVDCECGCIISRDAMRKHIKTDKHKLYLTTYEKVNLCII